ncbi:hypothetical protein ACFQZX_17270 [Mucilaginibacter litoreus]|uniref:Lipoprotein n=1 Tax=Mucilaginibacter litoreus TaxID=1048221 RepID=A0ABW3AY07_9SPHI
MKTITTSIFALFVLIFLSGCGLMEDVFKTGFIIALVLAIIIGLAIWILSISWKRVTKRFPSVRAFFENPGEPDLQPEERQKSS